MNYYLINNNEIEDNQKYSEYSDDDDNDDYYIIKCVKNEFNIIINRLKDPKNKKIVIWILILFLIILFIKFQNINLYNQIGGDPTLETTPPTSTPPAATQAALSMQQSQEGIRPTGRNDIRTKKGTLSRKSRVTITEDQKADAKQRGKQSVQEERLSQKEYKRALKARKRSKGFKKTAEGRQIEEEKKEKKNEKKEARKAKKADIKSKRQERKKEMFGKRGPDGQLTGQQKDMGGRMMQYASKALYGIGIFFMIIFIALSPVILYCVLLYNVFKKVLTAFKGTKI